MGVGRVGIFDFGTKSVLAVFLLDTFLRPIMLYGLRRKHLVR
jgi:hypothetical protein